MVLGRVAAVVGPPADLSATTRVVVERPPAAGVPGQKVAAGRGSGLIGLTDRVEALCGTIAIASPPGGGTSLRVDLPLAGQLPPTVVAERAPSAR